ncbi:hypothetical protein ACFQUX_23375 [Pantoea stewartii]
MTPFHPPQETGRIATEYVDAHGTMQTVSALTRQRLLTAMAREAAPSTPLPPHGLSRRVNR